MVVFDGRLKFEALAYLLITNLLRNPVRGIDFPEETSFSPGENAHGKKMVGEAVQEDNLLHLNRQKTVFVSEGQMRIFQYRDFEEENHNLSVTIIPCGSNVKWSYLYRSFEEIPESDISKFLENNNGTSELHVATAMDTVVIEKAKMGVYFIVFYPVEKDTLAHVYVTMDYGGPYELTAPRNSNIVFTPLRRQRLRVTWGQSLINPQNTSYCLVVNTKREQPSLCGAEEEGLLVRSELEVPVIVNLNNPRISNGKKLEFVKIKRGNKANNDTVIVCVDQKTPLTFTKLKRGVKYYFDLFAINNNTNFTVPYGKSSIRYNFTVRPVTLRDGVPKLVDLRKYEGKTLFRYKVRNSVKEIQFYVLVCGGAVDVEVKSKLSAGRRNKGRKGNVSCVERLPKLTRVHGYKRFRILCPPEQAQLYLKVNAPNVDELTRIKYVEVFVTVHPGKKYPMPFLPDDSNLYEFKSQKTCRSVTIGWTPVHDASLNTYCVSVWENRKFSHADRFRAHFQCDLNGMPGKRKYLFSPADAVVSKECENMITINKKSITNYKIRNLKPGKSYTIRVTVEKKNGRTLSYKYLKVYTKNSCGYY